MQNGGNAGTKMQWTGHDGGTQTEIRSTHGGDQERTGTERKTVSNGAGEVRVIVQPIQPVFYMPRQGKYRDQRCFHQ
jgi:hypothetical protein